MHVRWLYYNILYYCVITIYSIILYYSYRHHNVIINAHPLPSVKQINRKRIDIFFLQV